MYGFFKGTMCQCTNYHNTTNHNEHQPWFELLWSHVPKYGKTFDSPKWVYIYTYIFSQATENWYLGKLAMRKSEWTTFKTECASFEESYKSHERLKGQLRKRTKLSDSRISGSGVCLCYIIAEGFFLYYHFLLVISYHSVWLGLELFGLVHVQVHTLSAVHDRTLRMWQSQMS